MVMLHGCHQSPDDFAAGTHMNFVAEEHGCFVVYPEQSSSCERVEVLELVQDRRSEARPRRAGHHRRNHAPGDGGLQNRSETHLRRGTVRRRCSRGHRRGSLPGSIRGGRRSFGLGLRCRSRHAFGICGDAGTPSGSGPQEQPADRSTQSDADDRLSWRSRFDGPSAQWRRGHRPRSSGWRIPNGGGEWQLPPPGIPTPVPSCAMQKAAGFSSSGSSTAPDMPGPEEVLPGRSPTRRGRRDEGDDWFFSLAHPRPGENEGQVNRRVCNARCEQMVGGTGIEPVTPRV